MIVDFLKKKRKTKQTSLILSLFQNFENKNVGNMSWLPTIIGFVY